MRTLTLGVLIVSGGILASLPFRRYEPIPDASTGPAQLTGPTQSAVADQKLRLLVESPVDGILDSEPLSEMPAWSPTEQPPRRNVSIPLTYEDLLVPIDRPDRVEQRYSATVAAQQNRATSAEEPALIMPSVESLALSQRNEIESQVSVIEVPPTRPTSPSQKSRPDASFASTSSRFKAESAHVGVQPDRQPRHWIRQPD